MSVTTQPIEPVSETPTSGGLNSVSETNSVQAFHRVWATIAARPLIQSNTKHHPESSEDENSSDRDEESDDSDQNDTNPSDQNSDREDGDGSTNSDADDTDADDESDEEEGRGMPSCGLRHWNWTSQILGNSIVESYYSDEKLRKSNVDGVYLIYDYHTAKELKGFVQARGLEDPFPSGLTIAFYYLKTLHQADKNPAPFRFLDLAPEMRNLIYEYLLKVHELCFCGQIDVCTPSILRTCRQVYKEAKDFLYSQNTIKCAFTAEMSPTQLEECVMVHNGVIGPECFSFEDIFEVMDYFLPEFLTRVRKLEIMIRICDCRNPTTAVELRRALLHSSTFLFNLASFLTGDHCLEDLSIMFSSSAQITEKQISDVFWPMHRLRNITNVKLLIRVCGELVSPPFTEELVLKVNGNKETINTMAWLKLLARETHAYIDAVRSLPSGIKDTALEESKSLVADAEFLMVSNRGSMELIRDQKDEYDLLQDLAEAYRTLRKADHPELKKSDKLLCATKATEQYLEETQLMKTLAGWERE